MTVLRDEKGTAASKDLSHQTMMIKRNILAQCTASNYLQMTYPFLT